MAALKDEGRRVGPRLALLLSELRYAVNAYRDGRPNRSAQPPAEVLLRILGVITAAERLVDELQRPPPPVRRRKP